MDDFYRGDMTGIELTRFVKAGGPLTKRIYLDAAGTVVSDGSACIMGCGTAHRLPLTNLDAFAAAIANIPSHEALGLGTLRPGLPDQVHVVTKERLAEVNGAAGPDVIARTSDSILYQPGRPALALLDFDAKGMPADVAARLSEAGGFWGALVTVVPALASAARVARASTSAGLYRADTGERFNGSGGQHIYLQIGDGADAVRLVHVLHERAWLAGFGWLMVGAGGQFLERSIVDRMVGASERLVFEGAPVLVPPLAQDAASRLPVVSPGCIFDTAAQCPSLSIVERARLSDLIAKAKEQLKPQAAKAREQFVREHGERLVQRTGVPPTEAARIITRQCDGILLPDLVLPFDDPVLAGRTVADVLADPEAFDSATLADPLEGPEYGMCKARIMRRADGTVWIHSFAHGRTTYELRFDHRAVRAAVEAAPPTEAARRFVALASSGDFDADEIECLRDLAADRAGVGKRAIDRKLKAAQEEKHARRAAEERQARAAARTDPRPQLQAPPSDAEWLPQMTALNDVLAASTAPEPPMRDAEGVVATVAVCAPAMMHLLTGAGANGAEPAESRLPAPQQPLIARLTEAEVAELIERHIEYVVETPEGGVRPVHLAKPFVQHFWQRRDSALPIVQAVATMPLVLSDGSMLAGRGLDRDRGIVFRIADELMTRLPHPRDCTPLTVGEAMRFLCDDWLVDVSADYSGKAVLVALALTVIERMALPERPAFLVTAGQRGGGKTTAVHKISTAVLGHRSAAVAWSNSEEERRKALFALLGAGVPLVAWDNIARGTSLSCPSIEKALTSDTYADRVLGETEYRTVPAATVMTFTGNNITARGDLASRTLTARLAVDRPDPENRKFEHADPIGWTEAHRGEILRALYTILLGNPRFELGRKARPAETRFKAWWHLVGSAVEHAAQCHADNLSEGVKWFVDDDTPRKCPPSSIRFRDLFLSGESDDEHATSIATVLDVIRTRWPSGCTATEVAAYCDEQNSGASNFRGAIEAASGKAIKVCTSTVLTWRLKAVTDAPAYVGDKMLVLRYMPDNTKHGGTFAVKPMT